MTQQSGSGLRPAIWAWLCGAVAAVLLGGLGAPAAQAKPLLELRNLVASPPVTPVVLDRATLEALPQQVVRTHTEFTDGLVEFTGPLVSDVLSLIDTTGITTARMVALNDYVVEIPIGDFTEFGVILAMTKNGQNMTPRDKGPIWVIYPIDSNPKLKDPLYNVRMIWQLTLIELK